MTTAVLFRLQLVFAYVPAGLVVETFVLPWLQAMPPVRAQRVIATFHSFRFVGLVFLIPGVVGPALPSAFAVPAAYGDVATSLLAIGALLTVRLRFAFWSFVVAFNAFGIYDLVSDYARGNTFGLAPAAGQLGAAYVIPILYVPLLLLTHLCALILLVRGRPDGQSTSMREPAVTTM